MALIGPSNVLSKTVVTPLINKERVSFQHMVFLLEIGYIYMLCGDLVVALKLWCVMVLAYGICYGKIIMCPHRQLE